MILLLEDVTEATGINELKQGMAKLLKGKPISLCFKQSKCS